MDGEERVGSGLRVEVEVIRRSGVVGRGFLG